jgi:hypothetical protein
MPLTIIPGSGFPNLGQTKHIAESAPAVPAIIVLTATTPDAEIAAGQRRSGVEPEPAEREDERSPDG